MQKILEKSSHLTGSEGTEYDSIAAEGDQSSISNQNENIMAIRRLLGLEHNDLYTAEDLKPVFTPSDGANNKVPIRETLQDPNEGLSRREMNRAKRKV